MRDGSAPATLADVLAELRALRADVAELRATVSPELAERAALLAALAAEFGTTAFAAVDALEGAAARPDGDLAHAISTLIGSPAGGLRRLSRRLVKLASKPAGGFTLIRIGDDRGAALYVAQKAQWPV